MTDLLGIFQNLKRPKLLIRAAKFGTQDYNRKRDLRRLTHSSRPPSPARALESLLNLEGQLEQVRRNGESSYSVAKHVEVLAAMMAEVRLMPVHPGKSGPQNS